MKLKAQCSECLRVYFGLRPRSWLRLHTRRHHALVCEGCGSGETSAVDEDGYHLCRECGQALIESEQ